MKLKELLFIATHPLTATKVKLRQFMVAIEHQAPPSSSTFEEFPELPLNEAAKAIKAARRQTTGAVPKEAWSKEDQRRMEQGLRPREYPEHPNV